MMPAAITLATASPAWRTSSKLAMMQRATCGLGTSFTVTSTITASMPSLPTSSAQQVVAGRVERLGAEGPPARRPTVKPRTRSTLCRVRPYLRQCTPPEFSATLPPMVQAIWLLGSGA